MDDTGSLRRGCGNQGRVEMWTDQMTGAERSLVTVGRSLTVANGFPPLWKNAAEISDECVSERKKQIISLMLLCDSREVSRWGSGDAVRLDGLWRKTQIHCNTICRAVHNYDTE